MINRRFYDFVVPYYYTARRDELMPKLSYSKLQQYGYQFSIAWYNIVAVLRQPNNATNFTGYETRHDLEYDHMMPAADHPSSIAVEDFDYIPIQLILSSLIRNLWSFVCAPDLIFYAEKFPVRNIRPNDID